jgi:prepilin-type processing-associated H-X9-DG protein
MTFWMDPTAQRTGGPPITTPNQATTINIGIRWPTWRSVNGSSTPPTFVRQTLIPVYRCPSDPTLGNGAAGTFEENACLDWCAGDSSYAGNFLVFGKFSYDKDRLPVFPQPTTNNYETVWDAGAKIPTTFQDGTSNTIVFAEKYARCESAAGACCHGTWWMRGVFYGQAALTGVNAANDNFPGDTVSPVFAGGISTDPTDTAFGGKWLSGPDSKFQVQPKRNACTWQVASTAHAAMNVAMADGSVRSLSPTMSALTWYQACTPNGGEVLGEDWQ